MPIQRIHHVAYRCLDAKATVHWYQEHLGMAFVLAIAEDQVPSTHAPDPYMHVFLDAGGGNVLAFFELPNAAPMGRDGNTPDWVQHIAFKVDSLTELSAAQARLRRQASTSSARLTTPSSRASISSTRAATAWNWLPIPPHPR